MFYCVTNFCPKSQVFLIYFIGEIQGEAYKRESKFFLHSIYVFYFLCEILIRCIFALCRNYDLLIGKRFDLIRNVSFCLYFFLLNTFLKRVDAHKVPAFRRTLFIYMHIYSFTDTSGHHCLVHGKSLWPSSLENLLALMLFTALFSELAISLSTAMMITLCRQSKLLIAI